VRDREDESAQSIHAAQAARALAAGQPSTAPASSGSIGAIADRGAAIEAIERALRARGRRRWQRRWVLPSVAVAAAAAAAAVVVLMTGSHRLEVRPGGPGPVATRPRGDDLAAGTELRGPGSFEIAAGTRLRLDEGAGVRVLEAGPSRRFRLQAGALHAEVAKLSRNQRFVVETPDAEVEVKGTRFDVAWAPQASACTPATRTSVSVEEGIVAVRFAGRQLDLGPGQSWPACPGPGATRTAGGAGVTPPAEKGEARPATEGTKPPSDAKIAATAPPAPGHALVPAAAVARGSATRAGVGERRPKAPARRPGITDGAEAPGTSTLAEQNDLMAAALSARQRGNVAEALRWLDRLLDRYPDGQLAGSARAERRRLVLDGMAPREPEAR